MGRRWISAGSRNVDGERRVLAAIDLLRFASCEPNRRFGQVLCGVGEAYELQAAIGFEFGVRVANQLAREVHARGLVGRDENQPLVVVERCRIDARRSCCRRRCGFCGR